MLRCYSHGEPERLSQQLGPACSVVIGGVRHCDLRMATAATRSTQGLAGSSRAAASGQPAARTAPPLYSLTTEALPPRRLAGRCGRRWRAGQGRRRGHAKTSGSVRRGPGSLTPRVLRWGRRAPPKGGPGGRLVARFEHRRPTGGTEEPGRRQRGRRTPPGKRARITVSAVGSG
eukprot:scaffold49_cov409-Prasinococcus_capsulatus_cf.AAC.29